MATQAVYYRAADGSEPVDVYGFQDEAPDSKSRRTPKRELVVA